jgi:hypothetical protein
VKQRDLFSEPSVRKAPATYTDTQRLTAYYRTQYQQKFGEAPLIEPADGKILKSLITQFGYEKVRARLSDYLSMDDTYIVNEGYPLRLFRRAWNKLTAQAQARTQRTDDGVPRECAHRPRCKTAAAHTKRKIADMRTT